MSSQSKSSISKNQSESKGPQVYQYKTRPLRNPNVKFGSMTEKKTEKAPQQVISESKKNKLPMISSHGSKDDAYSTMSTNCSSLRKPVFDQLQQKFLPMDEEPVNCPELDEFSELRAISRVTNHTSHRKIMKSMKSLPPSSHSLCSDKNMTIPRKMTLTNMRYPSPIKNTSFIQNTEQDEIKHFETRLSDEEFMAVVAEQLEMVEGHISYTLFKKIVLPQHRKPTFTDFLRFRKIEQLLIKD